jgi:hypothetical protein
MVSNAYNSIQPYLAALGLSALGFGSVFLAAVAAVRWFGESWVTSKFSERLEAFKHAQQREIEQLKFQISTSMDRAVKLHQREFETVPKAWSTLVAAFNSVKGFTAPFQSYADVSRMNDEELNEFLDGTDLPKTQKNDILASGDRNKAYQEATFWRRLATVQGDFRMHHVFLLENAIFMPSAMKTKFTAIGDLAWDALMEHKTNHEMKVWSKRPQLEKFQKLGDKMLLELEEEIQKRLWSDVPLPELDTAS